MIKGFRQIALLTMLSRVFGLIRDIYYFYFFGAGAYLDAWFIAFKIPNLSRRLFGEGAASASLIPVYSHELHKDPKNATRLANTVVTVIIVILSIIVLLSWVGIAVYYKLSDTNKETRLILSLTSIMLPYMLFICTVAILSGILNVHKHFAMPAAAPIILNIFIIVTVVVSASVFKMNDIKQLYAVAIAVLVAGVVQLAMMIPPLRKNAVYIRPAWEIHSQAFKKILFMMGPMILGLTVTQINTLFDDMIAWWFSGSVEKGEFFHLLGYQIQYPLIRGCVSHLNAAQRLYQLPLGVFGISLATAIFPVMSTKAAQNDIDGLKNTISDGFKSAFFIGIPATVGLFLIARPFVSATFEHGRFSPADTLATSKTLLFYAIGLNGFFMQQIITRAFYAIHETKIPMYSALIAVVVNIILNLSLIWVWGTGGLALSTSLCSYLQIIILTSALHRKLGTAILHGMVRPIEKTIAATLLMTIAGVAILQLCSHLPLKFRYDIIRLALLVPATSIVYLLAAKFLRIEMLSLLTGRKSP